MSKKKSSKQDSPLETVTLTVGTAGHIDHGKTELIRLLTGCETDCLPEEKARGMTIDLGFATCELPNHRRVGIVDVPGHERFIHNMVAGAAGIDAVLLVVAADDGVMPQTVEHLEIVRLLGVSSGMVALTKKDLVSAERIEEVKEEISQLLTGSFMEGCPVVPISSKTGDGFEEFHAAFVSMVDKTAERDSDGPFRLHVERSFVLKGLGAIVSGIPGSGRVKMGDSLELLPAGEKKRVRGIQVYGKSADEGRAGECVALRMSDVSSDDVARGMVLASPGHYKPTRFVSAKFRYLKGMAKPLRPRTAIRFHVGTSDVPGHLVLPELMPLKPGGESYVQFQLKRPVVISPGDPYVVRMLSPVMTIGGGHVVAPEQSKMRRSRGDWEDASREREAAFQNPESAIEYALENSSDEPSASADLARASFIDSGSLKKHIGGLLDKGVAVELPGDRYVHVKHVQSAKEQIVKILNGMHDSDSLSIGFAKKDVFPKLTCNRLVLEKAISGLTASGELVQNDSGFQLASRAPVLSGKERELADRIVELFRSSGLSTPRQDELPAMLGESSDAIRSVFGFLVQSGEIVLVSDKVALHRDSLADARNKLVDHIKEAGSIESGKAKEVFGTTRKYSIPILEYWDRQGLTKRTGNTRVLREE